jgi:hypothetical protein
MFFSHKIRKQVIPVETVPGIGEWIKDSSGGLNSNMMHLIHCKNFYKYSNVCPLRTIIAIKKFAVENM